MSIPDPENSDFLSSQIPVPGSRIQKQQQKRGVTKIVFLPFVVATKITKFKITFIFELVKKKIRTNLQRIIELFTQKI
jgi:hypothetical protein